MMVLSIRIEHALDVAVQGPHDADPCYGFRQDAPLKGAHKSQ